MSSIGKKAASAMVAVGVVAGCATLADAQEFRFRFEQGDRRGEAEGKRANCEVYARIAVVQAEANSKFRCGYTDPRWGLDLGSHFRWCRFARRDVLLESQRSRAIDLQRCFEKLGDFDEDRR